MGRGKERREDGLHKALLGSANSDIRYAYKVLVGKPEGRKSCRNIGVYGYGLFSTLAVARLCNVEWKGD
jgi:hypothetical protein